MNGEMSMLSLMIYVLIAVGIAYLGLANAVIHLINYFKFYKPFNRRMLEYDIYTDKAYGNMIRGRLAANIVVFLLSGGITVFVCLKVGGVAMGAATVSFLAGLLLYSKKLRYELWNVQQFVRQYREYLDKEKFTRFLRKEYDISLEKLSDPMFVTQRLQRKGK